MTQLHLISHTHWDREWYRPFQSFRISLVRLIDKLLDLLEADPAFKFFMLDGQTIVLEDYLAVRPKREADLRKHIRSGRILIGPWHILPDEFLVSPEATIRNLLEGARICRRFGSRMPVGYIPDPFGHIGQMPQILRGFGMEYACFRRGLSDEPCELWWQAPDGSRVLTAYLRDGYDNAAGLPVADLSACLEEIRRKRDSLHAHSAVNDLLLMFGTDHMEPPPETTALLRVARRSLKADELLHSTLPRYFRELETSIRKKRIKLPIVKGELRSPKRHHLLPGVLSTRMWIKQENFACETLLEKWAEPFSAFAASLLRGENAPAQRADPIAKNPGGPVQAAWRLLLQNHPHDSICGCSVDAVHEEMRSRFAQVRQIGEEIVNASLQAIAGQIDTTDKPNALVVFNPHSYTLTNTVEAMIHPPAMWDSFELLDPSGNVIPYQSSGSAGQELINVILNRETISSLLGSLHEGRAANLVLRGFRFSRDGSTLKVQVDLAEDSSPDIAVWNDAVDRFREFLADPTIANFHVRARTLGETRIRFLAENVPGLGWRVFTLRKRELPPPATVSIPAFARVLLPFTFRLSQTKPVQTVIGWFQRRSTFSFLENDIFRIQPARDGTFTVFDKRTGEVFSGLNRFVDGGDCGDSYNFCPPANDRLVTPQVKKIVVEKGCVAQSLSFHMELIVPSKLSPNRRGRSDKNVRVPITSKVTIFEGVARVDVETQAENFAEDHRLRVHFSWGNVKPGQKPPAARFDGHFHILERDVTPPKDQTGWAEQWRPEAPQRGFTDLSNTSRGLMLANRGLPEVEVTPDNEIALTLLRAVGWLSRDDFPARNSHAGPMLPIPDAQMKGKHLFHYSILPHGGDMRATLPLARAYAAPFRTVETGSHSGSLMNEGCILKAEPSAFEVSAVKQACNGNGWIIRGWNTTADPITVTVRPWRRFRHVWKDNLAEENQGEWKTGKSGEAEISVKGFEILTLRVAE